MITTAHRVAQLERQVKRLKRKAARANDAKDNAIASLDSVSRIANLLSTLHKGGKF